MAWYHKLLVIVFLFDMGVVAWGFLSELGHDPDMRDE